MASTVNKVSVATEIVNVALKLEDSGDGTGGAVLFFAF